LLDCGQSTDVHSVFDDDMAAEGYSICECDIVANMTIMANML
jgi:hypothetical protein